MIVLEALQETVGGWTVDVNVVEPVAVQPLPLWVTITVYVPGVDVVKDEPDPVGDHEYEVMVFPAHAVAAAVMVRAPLLHVIGPLFDTVKDGRQVSTTALQEVLAAHPFDCVTITE